MGFVQRFFDTLEHSIVVPMNGDPPLRHARKITVTKDVVYDPLDPDSCRYDVSVRPSTVPRPMLLYFHGGGFVSGDKAHRTAVAQWYADNGYCVFNCNYGLCPTYQHPYPLRQLAVALEHARSVAPEYGADPTRIVLSGDSAGAYYAALLAAVTVREDLQNAIGLQTQARIAAVVLNCGLYDVELLLANGAPLALDERICKLFSGCEPCAVGEYEYLSLCSPRRLVTPDFAPSLVLYAKHDLVCRGQGEAFVAALRACGVRVSTYGATKPTDNHCFSLQWSSPAAKRANAKILRFLKEVCPSP